MEAHKKARWFLSTARVLVIASLVVQGVAFASPALAQEPDPGGDDGGGGEGGRGGQIVAALRQVAQVVIDIFIGIATILLAVGQFMVTVGHPYGLSQAWTKVIAVVILGIGAMLTIAIVNTVIDIMAGLIPATVIPSV